MRISAAETRSVTNQRCIKVLPFKSILQHRLATPKLLKAHPGSSRCETAPLCNSLRTVFFRISTLSAWAGSRLWAKPLALSPFVAGEVLFVVLFGDGVKRVGRTIGGNAEPNWKRGIRARMIGERR